MKFDNLPPNSKVRIFTLSGELVVEYLGVTGRQTWDGKNSGGAAVVPGVYLYRIVTGAGEIIMGKIFVVK